MSAFAIVLLAWIGFNVALLLVAWAHWLAQERVMRRAVAEMVAKAELYANRARVPT
jgi:hypothetical protein